MNIEKIAFQETLIPTEVQQGINTLRELYRNPNKRPPIMVLGEPILDIFAPHNEILLDAISQYTKSIFQEREGGRRIVLPAAALNQVFSLLQLDNAQFNLGGGANVIRGLACFAHPEAIVPFDPSCPSASVLEALFTELKSQGARIKRIEQPGRGNAVKIRLVNEQDSVIASLDFRPQEPILPQAMLQAIENHQNGTSVIISDYGRGMFTRQTLQALATQNPFNGAPIFIDPRKGAYNFPNGILKPNLEEAQAIVETKDLPPEQLARIIMQKNPNLYGVVLTLDGDGAVYLDKHGNVQFFPPGIVPEKVINPSGAGDIFISTMSILEAIGYSREDAIHIALLLASASVTLPGTSTLDPELLDYAESISSHHRSPLGFLTRYQILSRANGGHIPKLPLENLIGTTLENLRNLGRFLYPDAIELIRSFILANKQFIIWTQGEIRTPDDKPGYQLAKVQLADLKFPILGGPDKIQTLQDWLERAKNQGWLDELKSSGTVIIIDDKPENLLQAKRVFEEKGVPTQAFLIDRLGKHTDIEGVTIIDSLNSKELLSLIPSENALFLIDLDHTLLNHGKMRIELAKEYSKSRPPVPTNQVIM